MKNIDGGPPSVSASRKTSGVSSKRTLVEDGKFVVPYAVRASGLARAERRRFKRIPLSKAASGGSSWSNDDE